MFKKNNLALGILFGLVFPVLSWVLFGYWFKTTVFFNKPGIPYFAAILINLVLLRYLNKQNALKTSQGVMLATFVFMIFIFLIKSRI